MGQFYPENHSNDPNNQHYTIDFDLFGKRCRWTGIIPQTGLCMEGSHGK
jgi:hypothetical protein